jgi:hypothetical protein
MEHKRLVELEAIAEVKIAEGGPAMSRDERLKRWISVLESNAARPLRSLFQFEYVPPDKRRACRAENSPLTVAFEDPVLRREGLKGDSLGDVLDFFDITEHHLHYAFCSCHIGASFSANQAAQRLRCLLKRENSTSSRILEGIGRFFAAGGR